jgi:hypothetical protein
VRVAPAAATTRPPPCAAALWRAASWAGAAGALMLAAATASLAAAQSPATPSVETPALDQVLQLLAARRHRHVSFTEVHELAMLDRPLKSSGELLYDAPDHLEKRTLQPRAETLLLDHGVLTAQRAHHSYVLSLRDHPQVVPLVESVRATLAGDRAALERFFTLEFTGAVGHWTLTLQPTDATAARTVKQIRIEGERDAIHSVEVTETDGDTSVLTVGPELSP